MLDLKKIKEILNAELNGDPEKEILKIGTLSNYSSDSIIFSFNDSEIITAKDFGAIVVTKNNINSFPGENTLIVDDVRMSLANLSINFKEKNNKLIPLNESNYTNILFGSNCYIGNNVTIGNNCDFGSNIIIGSNCIIGNNVTLGHNVVIHSDSVISDSVTIDSGTIIGSEGFGNILTKNHHWHHIHHLGNVVIKNNVSIGSNCCIDRGTLESTIIKQGVIIDNLVHIAHNVQIGENTAIAAKTGIAGSTIIGKRNKIGGMVGIIDHIRTVDDVTISATSTVNQNILEPGTYTGILPITKHSLWKRIAVRIKKLDKINK